MFLEIGENCCTFLNQGGTFVFQSGEGLTATDPDMAKAMMIDGDKSIFKQNYYDTREEDWANSGSQITFDRVTNKYIQWIGPDVANFGQYITGFISLSINGIDNTNQLTEE